MAVDDTGDFNQSRRSARWDRRFMPMTATVRSSCARSTSTLHYTSAFKTQHIALITFKQGKNSQNVNYEAQ